MSFFLDRAARYGKQDAGFKWHTERCQESINFSSNAGKIFSVASPFYSEDLMLLSLSVGSAMKNTSTRWIQYVHGEIKSVIYILISSGQVEVQMV